MLECVFAGCGAQDLTGGAHDRKTPMSCSGTSMLMWGPKGGECNFADTYLGTSCVPVNAFGNCVEHCNVVGIIAMRLAPMSEQAVCLYMPLLVVLMHVTALAHGRRNTYMHSLHALLARWAWKQLWCPPEGMAMPATIYQILDTSTACFQRSASYQPVQDTCSIKPYCTGCNAPLFPRI